MGGPRCVQLHLRPPAHGCFPRCRWSFGRLFLGNWRLLDHRDSALSLNVLNSESFSHRGPRSAFPQWSCDHSRGLVTRHSVPCAEKFLLEALPSGTEPQGDGEEQQCPRPKTNLRTLIANCFREKRGLSWAIHVCKCLGTQATAVRGRGSISSPEPRHPVP